MNYYLVNKGEADPYADGTRLENKTTGKPATLLHQCPCTSQYLHYEVKYDDESKGSFYQHNQIAQLFILL